MTAMTAALAIACGAFAAAAVAQPVKPDARTVWDGVYSPEQAARGAQTYTRVCAYCHRDNLQGDEGPPLAGSRFTFQWLDRSVADLLQVVEATMPDDAPGSLPRQMYVDVIAFLLKANGYPGGTGELAPEVEPLKAILFTERPKEPRP